MASAPSTSKLPSTSSRSLVRPKPWYRHLTLDLLLMILANSIFHPWIALVFYLCLASIHKHREPLAYYTLYYTAFLAIVEVCIWVDHRVTYGKHRKVEWENEVVVITGGASGLGRVLAEMLLRKGVKVAVLDVKAPDAEAEEEMERWDLMWEVVDVSDKDQVEKVVGKIVDELGPPTILVNNAAAGITGLPLIPSPTSSTATLTLTPEQATKTMTINAVSHFTTLSAFLPHLTASKTGAHIITISSILSHLAPASLADYTASKCATSALHHTLRHELRRAQEPALFSRVKTLLVETGQLDTPLFADRTSLPFYAHFFGPLLEAKDVAKEILRTVERGDGGIIRMPFYARCMPLYAAMPGTLQLLVRWFSGIDAAIGSRREKTC